MKDDTAVISFVVMSFIAQSIIMLLVNVAGGGITMLSNAGFGGIIAQNVGNITQKTDTTIVTADEIDDMPTIDKGLPAQIWAMMWNAPGWIAKMGTIMLTYGAAVIINVLGTAAWITVVGYSTGGMLGLIVSIFGIIFGLWQVAVVRGVYKLYKG